MSKWQCDPDLTSTLWLEFDRRFWVVVAFGGTAGTIAYIVGPVPGHGPMDLRRRPIAAPLVFTLFGSAGAAALVLGQRARAHRAAKSEEE